MGVCLHVSLCSICTQCPWKPEVLDPLGLELELGYHVNTGVKSGLQEQLVLLTTETPELSSLWLLSSF